MRRVSGNAKIDGWTGVVVASDEVGYGAWAGPLVVCAASAPIGWDDPRIRDSKLFDDRKKRAQREDLFDEFNDRPEFPAAIVKLTSEEVDRMGVYSALLYAHEHALKTLAASLPRPLLGVVDGSLPTYKFDVGFDLVALPKADTLVPECALASILAKVTRDRIMREVNRKYPGYGFGTNMGYGGNAAHENGLSALGPCPEHRKKYAPIAKIIAAREAETAEGEILQRAWELLDDD